MASRREFESQPLHMSETEYQQLLANMSARDREQLESQRLGEAMSKSSQMGEEPKGHPNVGHNGSHPHKFKIKPAKFARFVGSQAKGAGKATLGAAERATSPRAIQSNLRSTSAAVTDVTGGVARGAGMTFNDIFSTRGVSPLTKRARGVGTVPVGLARRAGSPLRSSGLELLGRDEKVYKLSPVAPSRGVRGAVDYDALEGTFGPNGLFTRDQAVKVLVNIHSSAGQSLYGIVGRFAMLVREGYITEVEGMIAPTQSNDNPIYATNDPHNIWSAKVL